MRGRATSRWSGILLVALAFAGDAHAQSGRLLAGSAVTERADHFDLAIEFECSLRYRSHTPADQGDQLRISLGIGPDCAIPATAQFPTEFQLPADARDLVRGIELRAGVGGDAELVIRWSRVEQYVLAPAAGMRGLRIRVLRRIIAQVIPGELMEPTADYSVNIESSQLPFDELAVASAASLLQTSIYVSTIEVEGILWYRLRAGPFAKRSEADEMLRRALSRFPAAWLAIGDESRTTPEEAAARLAAGPLPPRNQRADSALDRQLEAARSALNARRLDEAIRSLTQIVAAEDYVRRPEALELLGLARERNGQLAQAKAAYEDYLWRYPDSPAAARVSERLQALRLADVPGRAGSRSGESRQGWSAWGNAAQVYRRDDTHQSGNGLTRDILTQNAVLTDADGLVRHRGERLDFTARSSMGYMKDLQGAGRENRMRVSAAYAELSDRSLAATARLGRQSRGMAGVNGLFDGLLGTWQAKPRLGVSLGVGSPVESTRTGPDFHRTFVTGAIDFAARDQRWEASAFALVQQHSGRTDRRSLGFEVRYLRPGRTLVALTEYDVAFGQLNSAMLLGTFITDSRWTFNLDASLQRSPQLTIRNALIGQPTLAFDDLTTRFTPGEIEQLALDRSARAFQLSATASHPLGDRGQWSLNLSSFDLSGMPASGGVDAVPAPRRDDTLSGELLLNSLLRAGDTHSFALRMQRGENGTVMSAGLGSRFPLVDNWRLTSRLRLDRRQDDGDDSWLLIPALRLEYQRRGAQFELEAGAELDRRHSASGNERIVRRFISAGYRLLLERRQP